MKLKKFAAMMLAGVMAVSMLAGCSGKGGNGGDNNQGEVVNTSSLVTAVNGAQEDVDFTANASLTSLVSKVASIYGTEGNAIEENIFEYLRNSTGNEYERLYNVTYKNQWGGDEVVNVIGDDDKAVVKNGEKVTDIFVMVVDGANAYNEEAAQKIMARIAAEEIGNMELPETTFVTDDDATRENPATEQGDEYVVFSYTGELSDMVAIKAIDGTTTYYAVGTITQTCAVSTFGK